MAQKIKIRRTLPAKDVKITGCEWSLESLDKDHETVITANTRIKFGCNVTLKMNTVGLNGYSVNVCFYTQDRRILLTERTNVLCVGGILKTTADTSYWKWDIFKANKKIGNQSVIAVVKYGSKQEEIENISRRGPLLLSSGKNVDSYDKEFANSITKSTVSQNNVNKEEYSSCKFDMMSLSRKNYKDFIIFDKNKNYKTKLAINRFYRSKTSIWFDFDRAIILDIYKPRLDALAEYLYLNKEVKVRVEGHTDSRGTEDFNLDLGTNRANVVLNYLVEKGQIDKDRLTSVSYGKREPQIEGEQLTDKEHNMNRRSIVSFDMNETMDDIVIYNLVSTTIIKPVDYKINISGYTNKGCLKADDPNHAHKAIFRMKGLEDVNIKENGLNEINYSFCANSVEMTNAVFDKVISWGSYYRELEQFLHHSVKEYNCHLHSCAFFSDVDKPSFKIKVFPDTLVTYDFRYNFDKKKEYTLRPELKEYLTLIDGDKRLKSFNFHLNLCIDNLLNKFSDKYLISIPTEIATRVKDIFIDFLEQELSKFQYGIHLFQDFEYKNIPYTREDESEKRMIWVTSRIEGYYMGILFVNLVVLLITRGKGGLSSKIAKNVERFKKLKKKGKVFKAKISDMYDLEFEYLNIAESSTVGYEKISDGCVDYVYRYKAKAAPLLAVAWSKEYSIRKMLKDEAYNPTVEEISNDDFHGLKDKIADSSLNKVLKNNAGFSLTITGGISFEYEIAYHYLQDKLEIYDIAGRVAFDPSQRKIRCQGLIQMEIDIEARAEYTIKWIPMIPDIEVEMDANVHLSAAIIYEKRFITKENPTNGLVGLKVQSVFKFTGLEYEFYKTLTVKKENGEAYYESDPDYMGTPEDPITGVLWDPFEAIVKTENL